MFPGWYLEQFHYVIIFIIKFNFQTCVKSVLRKNKVSDIFYKKKKNLLHRNIKPNSLPSDTLVENKNK